MKTLVDVAEALFDGRASFLGTYFMPDRYAIKVWDYKSIDEQFDGQGLDDNGRRMWFCLLVHEAEKS